MKKPNVPADDSMYLDSVCSGPLGPAPPLGSGGSKTSRQRQQSAHWTSGRQGDRRTHERTVKEPKMKPIERPTTVCEARRGSGREQAGQQQSKHAFATTAKEEDIGRTPMVAPILTASRDQVRHRSEGQLVQPWQGRVEGGELEPG